MNSQPLCFIDCETSGLNAERHVVLEVGALLTDPTGRLILEEYEAKVAVSAEDIAQAEPRALEINGYQPALWADALPAQRVAAQVHRLTDNHRLVGSNPAFDAAFLRKMLHSQGMRAGWSHRLIDVSSMAWPLSVLGHIGPKTGLAELCKSLGLTPEPAVHRALNGARCAWQVYNALMARYQRLPPLH